MNSLTQELDERRRAEQRGLLQATLWALIMIAVVGALALLRLITSS